MSCSRAPQTACTQWSTKQRHVVVSREINALAASACANERASDSSQADGWKNTTGVDVWRRRRHGDTHTHNNTNEPPLSLIIVFYLTCEFAATTKGQERKSNRPRRQVKFGECELCWLAFGVTCSSLGRERHPREFASSGLAKGKRTDSSPSLIYQSADRTLRKSVFCEVRAAPPLEITRRCGSNIITCERSRQRSTHCDDEGRDRKRQIYFWCRPTAARFSHKRPCQLLAESESGLNTLRKMHLINPRACCK